MNLSRLRSLLDPFVLALLGTVALASLLPARGFLVPVFEGMADTGIVLLFFLHGAKLSREAILAGAGNGKLHAAVFGTTFLAFPLIGLVVSSLPLLSPQVATGLLFLTLLPSTVQSSIALTAIARGNVAAAVCSASFSNLIGIAATPLLVALTMGGLGDGHDINLSWNSVGRIALQLLLPFAVGHAMRPWIGGLVTRNKGVVTMVDRGSILLVVYSAFGAAVVEGLWQRLSAGSIAVIALLCIGMLAVVLTLTWATARALGLNREDAIVLQFCGSKKSLASGVPMAGVLFPAAQVGVAILPLMLFHQIQLIVCAVIARKLAADQGAVHSVSATTTAPNPENPTVP